MCIKVSGDVLLRYEGRDEYYTLPDGIRRVEDNAFYDRGRLIELALPDSVTEIGDYAFKICSNMVSLRLPPRTERFGIGAFQQCRNLRRVDLPYGVKAVDSGMFVCCDYLASVTIPETVERIDSTAFATCRSLDEIRIAPEQLFLLPERQRVTAAITIIRESAADRRDARTNGNGRDSSDNSRDGLRCIEGYISDNAVLIGRRLIDSGDREALAFIAEEGLLTGFSSSELVEYAGGQRKTEMTAVLLSKGHAAEDDDPFDIDPFSAQ